MRDKKGELFNVRNSNNFLQFSMQFVSLTVIANAGVHFVKDIFTDLVLLSRPPAGKYVLKTMKKL